MAVTALTVVPVSHPADRTEFIRFPYSLYGSDDPWVPPLERERRAFLDPRRNPFFEHADAALFLARSGRCTVGRIAAVHNARHNEQHGGDDGFFGLFESVDDPEVACALFEAAGGWLRDRGLRAVLGPVSLSTNHEWGMLVDSFNAAPSVLMPYNHPYYPSLVEACGFVKAKDLWAWDLEWTWLRQDFLRLADDLGRRSRYTIRAIGLRDFDAEVGRIWALYTEIWADNWGFVPITEREFRFLVHAMKPIIRPELILIAEAHGEAVGALVGLPDANPALKAARGRLTRFGVPLGLIRFARALRHVDSARLVLLGVRTADRHGTVVVELGARAIRTARDLGIRHVEFSWILEDNAAANGVARYIGARRSKTYRVYRRGL
jgi:hypothetical protein